MNDNRIKSLNGIKSRSGLGAILKNAFDEGIISYCSALYRCGYCGKSQDQFFAPFFVGFGNGTSWILFPTNSVRNDRICIQQWNAENIKKINSAVKKAYVIVPDTVKNNEREKREVEKYNSKIESNEYYSAIDNVLYQEQFEILIKQTVR